MITYKDCPNCGARTIHESVRLCEVCETWEKAEQAISAQDEVLTRKYNEQLARAKRAEDENAAIRLAIETFAQSVDDAERHWEGRGGQHVPFFGDWACAVPSVRQRLKWWARHLRDAAKEGA